MKIVSVLFALGLIDACWSRSMQPATIKKRFKEAKYAFKFRVLSKSIGECLQSSVAVTTTKPTTTATTTKDFTTESDNTTQISDRPTNPSTTAHKETAKAAMGSTRQPSQADLTSTVNVNIATMPMKTTTKPTSTATTTKDFTTDSDHTTQTSDRPTNPLTTAHKGTAKAAMGSTRHPSQADLTSTVNVNIATMPMETTTQQQQTTGTLTKTTASYKTKQTARTTEAPATERATAQESISTRGNTMGTEHATNNSDTQMTHQLDITSTTAAYPSKPASPTLIQSNDMEFENNESRNSSKSMEPARRKRSCDWIVYHQDIKIIKKHIHKGCGEIKKMKRIQKMNEKSLKSTIRLQMDFKELKPNKNYLFMGRAIPGQDPEDHVFMADELTVVPWYPEAVKLKKHFKSKRERCN